MLEPQRVERLRGIILMKETNELRKLTDKELLEKRKELKVMLVSSYAKVSPKIKPGKRGKVRRGIARIDTILGERKRRGFTKEQNKYG